MSSRKCFTCENKYMKIVKIAKSKELKEFERLTKFLKKEKIDLKTLKKKMFPKKYNFELKINLGKKYQNRFIYYFAALPKINSNCNVILDASKAYGDYSNSGLTKTNKDGKAILRLHCPQLYKEEGNTYISHVHFLISEKNNEEWNKSLKTTSVNCNVSHKLLKEIIKTDCALILNALPMEYYIKKRIPHSYPLPYTLVKSKLTKNEIINYLKDMLKHSNKLYNSVKSKKLNFMDIPIVLYCYNEKCNASHILQEYLIKYGFKNVRIYLPGIRGWIIK